jgi:peptidoglycan L-alanyl-D-glutamate endopeptidase CwlK
MCRKHQHACQAAGIPFRVTYRSNETQDILYSLGRTRFVNPFDGAKFKPGQHVTNARAGSSFHNYGPAYDGTPECLLALPSWGDTPAHQKKTDQVWTLYGKLGKEFGLRWGGDFKSIRDRPHMEWSGALSLSDLRAGR